MSVELSVQKLRVFIVRRRVAIRRSTKSRQCGRAASAILATVYSSVSVALSQCFPYTTVGHASTCFMARDHTLMSTKATACLLLVVTCRYDSESAESEQRLTNLSDATVHVNQPGQLTWPIKFIINSTLFTCTEFLQAHVFTLQLCRLSLVTAAKKTMKYVYIITSAKTEAVRGYAISAVSLSVCLSVHGRLYNSIYYTDVHGLSFCLCAGLL